MRSTLWILLIIVLEITSLKAQIFQQFIEQVTALPEEQRQATVDSFMNAGHQFPFTEMDTLVGFVYQGNKQNVALAGDATNWNPNVALLRISGTDFWYFNTLYETDARLDYKYVLDGDSWILDPLNPNTCTGGFGSNSELRMPAYMVPPEIMFYPEIPHGTMSDTVYTSTNLGNSRTVKIYLPAGYDTSGLDYPLMLFHDGTDYINLGDACNILDYLIAEKMITPVIGIFVPPVDRTEEYAGSKKEAFRKFIVDELMPFMDQRYRIDQNPQKRAMIGASNGGNIALYIGMKNSESFGKIGAQSSNVQVEISNTFQGSEKLDLEFYLDIGTYDIPLLIPLVENLSSILQNKGYSFQYYIFHEGHSWGNWKGHLRLPLIQFFPYPSGLDLPKGSLTFNLRQNYPNPFHDRTTIPFSIPPGTEARMVLQDMQGHHLETLFSTQYNQPENPFIFHNQKYPSGSYIYSLIVEGSSKSKKLTIIR